MGGECGMCGGEEKVIHGFVEETKKKITWKTYRRSWEDNIRTDLKINRLEGGGMD
jgi:hypothetical protein